MVGYFSKKNSGIVKPPKSVYLKKNLSKLCDNILYLSFNLFFLRNWLIDIIYIFIIAYSLYV